MKPGTRSFGFGMAIGIALICLHSVPGYAAASCALLDSGQARPQYMLDRMPACGGTAPAAPQVVAASGSLTTLFASDNSGAPTGGIYFDVQDVAPNPVTITSWDTNLDASFTGDVSVWYRPGTYSGFEDSSAGWILVGTATGIVSAGTDVPTPLNVGQLVIPAGTTYGIAISLAPTAGSTGHTYTNGTGSNQVYNDGVLQISTGSANNVAFNAPLFTPRVWNGTINYDVGNAVAAPAVNGVGLALLSLLLAGIAFVLLRRRHA
ncbi:MAG: hypothetical protein ACREPN_07640 [Rudaea sp.]